MILIQFQYKKNKRKRGRPQNFVFTIKKVGEINMDRLHMFLNGKISTCPDETIMALDVILRNKPSLVFTPIGRCFFNRDDYQKAYGGIEFWRGYYQSVRPGNGKLFINMDTAAAAFYQPGNLSFFISFLFSILFLFIIIILFSKVFLFKNFINFFLLNY